MKQGLKAAWPIALGYFPVAVAFGALGAQAGLGYLWIQLTSLLVFAGASQFALVGLLAQGVPPLLAASLGLLLNLRHAFYGPALRPYLKGGPLEAFFLTDEVFALALRALPGLPPGERRGYFLGLGLGAYLSWNLGTALGALGAKGLLAWPRLGEALAFALPALFLLLALPHLRNPVALLAGGVALGFHLLGQTAWGLFLAGVVGFLWKEPWKGRKA
ncbi:transporter [Thermus scotoductus]|uniref:Transporter n=1 Tax=Thermus scotoductus TaxID=37636 RepID=A0A430UT38_THESC|nr:AzlC family ABC transporter permease [Thermus scotoductus]RTI11757.1 transporter [Thermus scotoductus]